MYSNYLKICYRMMKPPVSQTVELGCRGSLEALLFRGGSCHRRMSRGGLVLDRPRTRYRIIKESLATFGSY